MQCRRLSFPLSRKKGYYFGAGGQLSPQVLFAKSSVSDSDPSDPLFFPGSGSVKDIKETDPGGKGKEMLFLKFFSFIF